MEMPTKEELQNLNQPGRNWFLALGTMTIPRGRLLPNGKRGSFSMS
jgi:hypothetical protein